MFRQPVRREVQSVVIALIAGAGFTLAAEPGSGDAAAAGGNYVSQDKSITDHADSGKAGSLAWHVARTTGPPAVETEIVLPGGHVYAIKSNLTIPWHLTLTVRRGAILDVKDGATLTIDGGIEAGPWRIFGKTGQVAGAPAVDFVRPQWWGTDTAALQAAVKFKRVHLGRGMFTIDSRILIGDDTHITGEPGCEILSARTGLNLNEGIFTNLPAGKPSDYAEPVRNVTIDGVKFRNTTAIGLYCLALFTDKGAMNADITFVNCEAVGCALLYGLRVKNIVVKDNYCHSSTLEREDYADLAGDVPKYSHQNGVWLCGAAVDVIISNNRILGLRCVPIGVVCEAVYNRTYEEMDPDQSFPGKRILIEGNQLRVPPNPFTAAGIYVAYAQDCRIIGNYVDNVNDTALDFEGSRNCIADSNVIVNGGKCMAMWGNNKNITYSNNIVYLTEDRHSQDSPFFVNSYSNGYDPPIVDLRSTDLFITGNTFCASIRRYEKPWAAAIVPGTAKRLYIRNNNFINARLQAHFCDDLETIEVTGNSFYNELEDTGAVVHLAVSERNKTEKQPTKNFIISGNHFRSVNDAGSPSIIQVDSAGGTKGNAPYSDLNVVIENNIVDRETTEDRKAISFLHNYDWGHADSMKINCIIRNNVTNAEIAVEIPEKRRESVNLVAEGNTQMASSRPSTH